MPPPPRICAYINCGVHSTDAKHLRFFRFPSNPALQQLWVKNSGLKLASTQQSDAASSGFRLCERHFLDTDFKSSARLQLIYHAVPLPYNDQFMLLNDRNLRQTTRTYAKPTAKGSSALQNEGAEADVVKKEAQNEAEPSIPPGKDKVALTKRKRTQKSEKNESNAPAFVHEDIAEDVILPTFPEIVQKPCSCDATVLNERLTEQLRKINARIRKIRAKHKRELAELKDVRKLLPEGKTPPVRTFIKLQLSKGRTQFSAAEMRFARSLYKQSAPAYSFLRKQGFLLPRETTLKDARATAKGNVETVEESIEID